MPSATHSSATLPENCLLRAAAAAAKPKAPAGRLPLTGGKYLLRTLRSPILPAFLQQKAQWQCQALHRGWGAVRMQFQISPVWDLQWRRWQAGTAG